MARGKSDKDAANLPLFAEACDISGGDEGRAGRRGGVPYLASRLIDAAAEIASSPPDRVDYLHSVLCQVGLPRRRTDERVFRRSSGKAWIEIVAGSVNTGAGKGVPQPMPYGTRPRLALVHISSEAIRTSSREIDIGSSVREFLRRLGIDTGGREYKRFQTQMVALAACRMTLGVPAPDTNTPRTIKADPIEELELWLDPSGRQGVLWPGRLLLSDKFYNTLREYAVPMDPRSLAQIKGSALALDIYAWLAHRLFRVNRPAGVKVSWANLKEQFGQEYKSIKDFKYEMKKALSNVLIKAYPTARISDAIGGITLLPSPPPIAKKVHPVKGLPAKSDT